MDIAKTILKTIFPSNSIYFPSIFNLFQILYQFILRIM